MYSGERNSDNVKKAKHNAWFTVGSLKYLLL